MVSKMVCHDLVAPMTMAEIDIMEKDWIHNKS